MMGITFKSLRIANRARLPLFKNAKGQPAHSKANGSDWSPADWMVAVTGEVGEMANLMKKVRRGDLTLEEAKPELADEAADIVTYLDILCQRLGIDLGEATREKFNRKSVQVGAGVKIIPGGEVIVDGFRVHE